MRPTGTVKTTGQGKQRKGRKSIREEVKEETDALEGEENTRGRGKANGEGESNIVQTESTSPEQAAELR